VIHSCYTKDNWRPISASNPTQTCKSNETPLSWNASGPAGATGPTGGAGPAGPPGPANLAALQGSPCTVGGKQSKLNVEVDATTGEVSMTCLPPPSLVLDAGNAPYPCYNGLPLLCWGSLSGQGLQPGAEIDLYDSNGRFSSSNVVGATGAVGPLELWLECKQVGVYAVSTAPDGSTITSNSVSAPFC
jgi:hypothetical protein